MIRTLFVCAFSLAASTAMAQMTPVGLWRTISDKDGAPKSEVRIVESGGALTGKIEKILDPKAKPDERCEECTDERKGQLILGMEILRGLKKVEGKDVWEGGNVLDPNNGKVYRAKVTPIDGGAKLEMRGYLGTPMFGRTQTWIRIQ